MAEKKPTARVVDFTNVKERGNFNPKNVEPGDYVAKITKVEETQAKDGEDMWVFTIVPDEFPRTSYPQYIKLVETQSWKLKNLLEAAGIAVGQRKVKLDPNKLVGKKIGIALEDEEYDGRLKSVIVEVFPAEDVTGPAEGDTEDPEEEELEEEKPAPKKRTAAAKKKAPEPEKDEEEEDDELEIDEL